jgi:hypothetical protein
MASKTQRPEEMLIDTPCKCGHELGDHRSSKARECLHESGCQCERFRKATPKK